MALRTILNFFSQCQAKADESAKMQVPHPIPSGKENAVCPVTGLFLTGDGVQRSESTGAAFAAMQSDPDILEEKAVLASLSVHRPCRSEKADGPELKEWPTAFRFVPLNVSGGAHRASADTRLLVHSVGLSKLRDFAENFYKKAFADPHLDRFLRRHDDPHGERFSLWVVEKFGDGTPWTEARMTRPRDLMQVGKSVREVAFDRSSAHLAAWHSPKREPHKLGNRFKPDDVRVWMRLHFWAAREVGLFEPQYASFMCYYIRFIGHFISVYSSISPPFTRDSARWSADPQNISRYVAAGNMMLDVIDKPVEEALLELPPNERVYTGSKHPDPSWPYQKVMRP